VEFKNNNRTRDGDQALDCWICKLGSEDIQFGRYDLRQCGVIGKWTLTKVLADEG